jgi:hypothetical protein
MASCRSTILPGWRHTLYVAYRVSAHTVRYVSCEELWLVTEGGEVCVSALECGEFQGPKCVNFFGNDFAPKVTLACCNCGFIAQLRFPLEPLVAQLISSSLWARFALLPLQFHRLHIFLFPIFIFIFS